MKKPTELTLASRRQVVQLEEVVIEDELSLEVILRTEMDEVSNSLETAQSVHGKVSIVIY